LYDIAIKNGSIIDPETLKITVGNVYVKNGSVADITRDDREAAETVNALGQYVSPGFIDIHTHIEGNASNGALMAQQGVTTVLNGNCGMGPDDPAGFLEGQGKKGFIINQLELAGATVLRKHAGVTDPFRPLNGEQTRKACAMLEEQLQRGCAGLSFGLEYCPGTSEKELLALSGVAARYGRLVAVHTRSDCYSGLGALDEAININRVTGAPVQVSHVVYQYGYGMMRQALQMIGDAVDSGYDVSCDSGMYTSFATYIGTPVFGKGCFEKWKCSYGSILAASGPDAGHRMTKEIFEKYRKDYPNEVAIALIGVPDEISMAFGLPYMMVSSDAGVNQTGDPSMGHPQDAGTFPRFLYREVKEEGRLRLADAVRRITLLPAKRLGLGKKGRIAVGNDADITVFDLGKIKDNSQFSYEGKCDALPDGISAVIVNGKTAVMDKKVLCVSAGKAIRDSSERWTY